MATNRLALQSPDPANRLPYWPEADVQEPNVCLSGSSRRHAKFYARVRTAICRIKKFGLRLCICSLTLAEKADGAESFIIECRRTPSQ